ncbi:MazG-like family protein [Loigolactobacillus bifermentans]|jgi:NTP pyrophosphatase (non-canonical NTP hydrolase)|uniref:NTP pyrophosphohydrolase MazG-like domain-containing protein n=1 Tax=Loigolactobacillus bifermentans DSM 20003 TaxID=1423726 RepID=A0A0R1H2R0_9LACO|nr:MazG-like family protein [Loigolactobacillus bifermentans]KRK40827.1 hypothetical protein FC07_GL002577 [Loigolactobacillus bifermentans DSM 20003]QGG59582.1 hypothetical protein LB003_03285 [Loigolactobacillus bifermentans]
MIENTKHVYVTTGLVDDIDEILMLVASRSVDRSVSLRRIFDKLSGRLGPQVQLYNLTENIQMWSEARRLDKQDPTKQLIKMQEELGELAQGYLKEKPAQVIDSLGDLLVVITIFCQQEDLELAEVLQEAWNQIKDRHGKIVDGTYVKDSDLNG